MEDHANNREIFLILFDIRKSTFDQISIWATRGLSSVWCKYHNTSNYHNYEKHEITVEGILEYSASIAAWLSWECLRPNGGLVAKLHGRSTLVLLLGQNLALRAKRLHQRLSRTRTWINGILSLNYSFTQNMVLDQVSFQFMSRKSDSCWRGGVVKLRLSDYSRKGVLRKPDFLWYCIWLIWTDSDNGKAEIERMNAKLIIGAQGRRRRKQLHQGKE